MWFISAIALLAAGSAYGQPSDCRLDICFLVDASSSIGRPNWNAFLLPFLQNMVKALYDHPIDANVGIQTFSTTAGPASLTLTNILAAGNLGGIIYPAISGLVFLKGFTSIADGIQACHDNVFNNGDGNNRLDAEDVIILISDGVPTRDVALTLPVATACKNAGVHIITVAVGTFSTVILQAISSNNQVLQVGTIRDLQTVVSNLTALIWLRCNGPPPTSTTTTTPPPPLPAPELCPNCSGDWIPEPTYTWSDLEPIELQWFPLSEFTKPDPDIPDPDELFELEAEVLYYSSYVWYVGFVPPVYPVATTTRTPLPPP